jgi:predicted nucleic acid-binding protein
MKNLYTALVFTALIFLSVNNSFAQEEKKENTNVQEENKIEENQEEKNKKNESESVQEDTKNELGLIYSAKKLEEANNLIKENKYPEAEKLIIPIKEWLTESTEMHYSVYQIYNKQDKHTSQEYGKVERAHAIDFGQLRDQSYYLLAKVYIAQNKIKDAARLLVFIIKSEPNTGLGKESYKLLQDIRFSDRIK